MRRREMIHPVVLPDQYHQVAYVEATSYSGCRYGICAESGYAGLHHDTADV